MSQRDVIEGPCVDCCVQVTRDLSKAGSFRTVLASVPLRCDRCIDQAATQRESDEHEKDRERRRMALRRDLAASGLPAAHHSLRLDAVQQPGILTAAARNWARHGGGLLLSGRPGVGKTTLAGAAALERLHAGLSVAWTSAPMLFAMLGTGLDSEPHARAASVLRGRDALVLDDIDKSRPTPYGAEQLFVAIDNRIEWQRPVLVTTNLDVDQLEARYPEPYGSAIASRLVGYCEVHHIEGYDRRIEVVS